MALYARSMTSRRTTQLIAPSDPIPDGALFVEARFSSPEGGAVPLIADAVVATLDNGVLAAAPQPGSGRFPLPAREDTRATLSSWGADRDTPIVVYATTPDDAKTAARAWFVFRDAGFNDVRVLDGGIAGWRARQSTAAAAGLPQVSDAPLTEIDANRAAEVGASGILLDARPVSAYKEGRIPGALSAPGNEVFRDGYLLPEEELRAWAAGFIPDDAGDAPVAAYCGGGVAAAGTVFALSTLGIDAGLYVGSWSQWSRDNARPVER